MYADSGVAARRFQKEISQPTFGIRTLKYGPYLPIGKDGTKKQVYLVTFVDDATRLVLHGQFYIGSRSGNSRRLFPPGYFKIRSSGKSLL